MASSRELAEQAFSLLQEALRDSENRAAELDAELKRQRAPKNAIEQQAEVLEHRLETVDAEREHWHRQATQLDEILENERAKIQALKKRLEIAESGPDRAGKKEVNYWRSRAEQFDEETKQYKQRIAELKQEVQARAEPVDGEIVDAGELEQLKQARADAEQTVRDKDIKLAELTTQVSNLNAVLESVRTQNSQLNSELANKGSELTDLASQLNAQLAERTEATRLAEQEKLAVREQIAGLEEELREEKECTVDLSELANERHEQITELSEKLDEAQERYEEAKWHLERAARFERLVAKRRKLIDSLLDGIRAKQKSNTALKAGLDGLRKFKAKSERQQQKLLVRIEDLSGELKEAREQLVQQKRSEDIETKLRRATETIEGLESRLATQVEIIETLESELSAARGTRQAAEDQANELSVLKAALEIRNETISKLEADINEQQKALGKLRGSESETMRLKAVKEQDQGLIEDLQMQVDTLTAELAKQESLTQGGAEDSADAWAGEIRQRESQISDLNRTLREQEKEIAKLREEASGWQKKYEFISTEAPAAYQSAAAEK